MSDQPTNVKYIGLFEIRIDEEQLKVLTKLLGRDIVTEERESGERVALVTWKEMRLWSEYVPQ